MARQRPHRPSPPEPLPGTTPLGVPGGMYQYVVNLVPPDLPIHNGGSRAGVVDAFTHVAAEFVGRAKKAIAEHGLTDQVDGFGEAYGLPVVTLTATPSVAAVLEKLPGVEAVYRDDNRLGLTT